MSRFLRPETSGAPAQPTLKLYELGEREWCAQIDYHGGVFVRVWPSELPLILFADVPVMLHLKNDLTIAPFERANDHTGPER